MYAYIYLPFSIECLEKVGEISRLRFSLYEKKNLIENFESAFLKKNCIQLILKSFHVLIHTIHHTHVT